jgi:hypothetical protein
MATPTFILPSAPTYTEGFVNGLNVYPNPTNFVANQVPFTRATTATRTNAAGLIELVPYNLLQRSEEFDNASWSSANNSGLGVAPVVTANAAVAPDGTTTADRVVFNLNGGTTTSDISRKRQIVSNPFTGSGTISFYVRSFDGVSNYTIAVEDSNGMLGSISVTGEWTRITRTATTYSVANIGIGIGLRGGQAIPDSNTADILIWGAQLVEGTDALPYLLTETRLNRPRVDFSLGGCPNLLLEPQRTNSIRNSTMVGAVAGTPGTLPTNWSNSLVGLTQTIVGVGSEGGVNYIDFRFNGTATGTVLLVFLDTTTSISASNGQSWTLSNYIKLVSAPSGASSYNLVMHERTIAGAYVTEGSIAISPTSTLGRFTYTRTLAGGVTVAFVQPIFRANLSIGTAYDFTIRIAAPQMELGAYPTTYIPTTSTSVTRNSDVISRSNIFTNGYITSAGGTWFVNFKGNVDLNRSGSAGGLFLNTGTISLAGDGFLFRNPSTFSQKMSIIKYNSGTPSTLYNTLTENVKAAIKWNGTTADVFVNGVKVVSATAFTVTNMENLIGEGQNRTLQINSMALYPIPLSDTELINLTTL